jgi:hypothetical protein
MKIILKPIALNERSYNANLLHKVLYALGLPVAKREVAQGKAGNDTLKKVRALQAQLNVPVDGSILVDEVTSLAIAEVLEKRGLTTANRSFTVTGTVRLQNGAVKKRRQLLAFDLDLRGVAVYRNINSIEEIKKSGFEFLGQTVSDNRGNYHITFYDWQYQQAERKKADVVVYAIEGEQIIGRSGMVNSEDYSDKGLVRELEIIITQKDKRTEYEALMSALNAFLKESQTSLGEIALSHDQLVFTAGELDVDLSHLTIATNTELLTKQEDKQLSHELLYSIGRQNIRLSWSVLYKKQAEELSRAIAKSVDEQIIRKYHKRKVDTFIHALLKSAVHHVLDDKDTKDKNTLNTILSNALPQKKQRISFLNALNNFKGSNFREFWSKHLKSQPEFKNNPELISGLLFTQQLTLLTGNHQALVKELQVNKKLGSPQKLIELEKSDWGEIIKKTGLPDFIEGKNDEEKIGRYAGMIQSLLDASFPTERIAKMVEKNELSIEKKKISKSIGAFLSRNEKLQKDKQFDFARSRIHDFKEQIKAVAGKDYAEVRSELMKIQRVFQVSTRPEVMSALLEKNLHSAYSIASIPRKSFIKTYAKYLGGEQEAFAVHQRASHTNKRAEMTAMHFMEYIHGLQPRTIMDKSEYKKAMKTIQDHLPNPTPNYAELFGSPDICECKHCRSVYSAAAYYVDLLRFLEKSSENSDGHTPYDILIGKKEREDIVVHGRRPDLVHLPLTCENTNTIIPYIDLVNEVMEYYTANGSLTNFEGYNTGEATAEELRANPQNFNLEAYRRLKDVKYPFTLPYHQPLDAIRTYSDHLKVSRHEAMMAMNPQPDFATKIAIEVESLGISQEEYTCLMGYTFGGTADATPVHEYFGYTTAGQLEDLSKVPEFLQRSGVAYTDLVELLKTQFINPYQSTLDFLEKIFSYGSIDVTTFYARLEQIEAETLDPADDADIVAALNDYNSAGGTSVTTGEFAQWVTDHLTEFRQVITLYEPDSKCDLETTRLRTIQSIYEGSATSGITSNAWSKIHRFIRIWRKFGWNIHETDLTLTIFMVKSISLLQKATKRPLDQLAALWVNIDTYGDKSLYKKLFLNKAVQRIDNAFKADAWGNYLQRELDENGDPITLAKHQSAILAAFRITEEDLNEILEVARVIDAGNPRSLDMDSDILNIQNLSTIYRYVLLAKALKMRVKDLCKLIDLFSASPFSTWDIEQGKFTNIAPDDTYEFYKLVRSTKEAGFKPAVLEYIFQGTAPADSPFCLNKDKALKTGKAIRDAFTVIEQDHPETHESSLTSAILTAKLSLTFQPEIVSRFMGIIEGTEFFATITDANLNVIIPDDDSQDKIDELVATSVFASQAEAAAFLRELSRKYTYVNGSGRLTCTGVMSDTELMVLKGLVNVNPSFKNAIDELYTAPETFISDNFNEIFNDLDLVEPKTYKKLLDHPAQNPATTPGEKLLYVYEHFLPVLKSKLRKDTITQHIATLIGLSEEATALLIAGDIDALITDLSTEGFSATYFSDANWNTSVLERTDNAIDFSWGNDAPDPLVPADNFSVRWKAYIAAPASGEYTLVVEVEDDDEVFKLYRDDTLILEKFTADAATSLEVVTDLNAAYMHLVTLEYAEVMQNAGIRLRWKTAATAPEIIPASAAYPAAILDNFTEKATVFHRAAKFILEFEISEIELDHFVTYKADFDNIDFKAIEAKHWKRINDYMNLRNAVPQAQALLTDIFALANRSNPLPTVDELTERLYLATAWDEASLEFLVATHFTLGVDDFKNEIALNWLYKVMQIVAKTGISAETIAEWGTAETDFDTLHSTAQLIKNTAKAKYEEEDWLDLAGTLSNKIRENQKQALISYLLTRDEIKEWGARDADGLFEYLLIDVQMEACMDTSRIVQANAAIQMFVNRCLLNLEKDVSPDVIDKDHWEWMKNYRVWEANRKVFLYPENWLEPEWRNNRSEFFKELESYLVQNDIAERSVEQGFRNYLTSLNEVANLEVCALYRENYGSTEAEYFDDSILKYLHVFARSHNAPYKFFYRTWNEYQKWSAWEKVPVDIRSVEDGDNSGVHLIPMVWRKRLLLFWPEFQEVQEAPSENSTRTVKGVSGINMSHLEPKKYWEIRLAWSEYVDGKWSPKQVSKEFVEAKSEHNGIVRGVKDFLFSPHVVGFGGKLQLQINIATREYNSIGWFNLSDMHSPIRKEDTWNLAWSPSEELINQQSNYAYSFSNRSATSTLEISGEVYLQKSTEHRLVPVQTYSNQPLTISLESPFFFSDVYRTYFVRPVNISIRKCISSPEIYNPGVMVGVFAGYDDRIIYPDVQPDDYPPIGEILPPSTGGTPTYYASMRGTSLPLGMVRSGNMASGATSGWNNFDLKGSFCIVDMPQGCWEQINAKGAKGGLEFHTFHHPFSNKFVTNLNQSGLSRGNKPLGVYPPGLMESDTEIPSDEGATFESEYLYDPNFTHGLVIRHSDFDTPPDPRTAYKENVCFDVYGANSLYNWELFFHAPLYIATRLSKNGKYEEAMKWFHYIFDPTTDMEPEAGNETSRYWKVLPFKTTPVKRLEEWFDDLNRETDPSSPDYNPHSKLSDIVSEWRDNPFDPHLVASNRNIAYKKHVVIKYVENLIAWGDSLFRQFTRESVYEAIQIYVIANHILGPRPEFVPKRGEIKAESYYSLQDKWDDFSNALVQLENIFPYSSEVSVDSTSTGTNLLGIGPALHFCIPANEKMLEYWDTVTDRLFKIRHCQDIDGVERRLALFAPPISPAALIQAASQGLSLGSILADLSSPPPIYRFNYVLQKANEFCADVKTLGSALLSALEKKDGEELSRLRASHENQMLELVTAIRERQVLDAKANKENLLKARETAEFRLQHFIDLLGNDTVTVPAAPTIGATLTSDSQLAVDTNIVKVETDVDESLVDSDESGVKLIPKEAEELAKSKDAMIAQNVATGMEALAGIFHLFPQVDGEGTPLGVGVGAWWGGQNLGSATSALAKVPQIFSQVYSYESSQAAKMASYIRREQDWTLQANLAAKEIIQLDKQITSADIRIQVTEKELENHKKQIENAKEVELFLQGKFTNQELYQWMKEQLFAVYKQSYNLAYDMAKKAEKAYKYEMGTEMASFIQYGYWDNSKQGLVAGEKLQLALRQLEKSYIEENRRELELTKNISLALLNPLALIELRETGKCYVSLPEELFDLDFQGHYFRRIKSMSLSIPCIAGPYTTVNCSLRLLKNTIRINSIGNYEHENDEGLWIDDDRFRTSNVPVTSIATSTGQNDAGMFEFNFRDERYLPFEGAGAISDWQIELSTEKELRQFDYSTISDVILHLKFMAREGDGLFKENAVAYIKEFIMNTAELADQPLMRMFSMRHEFPSEWHKFLHPGTEGSEQVLSFTIGKERFPFFVQDRTIVVMKIEVFAKSTQAGDYQMVLSYINSDEDPITSSQITMPQSDTYGGLNKVTINMNDAGLYLEEMDIAGGMNLKMKHSTVPDYTSLATDEAEDIFVVFHYKLGNKS